MVDEWALEDLCELDTLLRKICADPSVDSHRSYAGDLEYYSLESIAKINSQINQDITRLFRAEKVPKADPRKTIARMHIHALEMHTVLDKVGSENPTNKEIAEASRITKDLNRLGQALCEMHDAFEAGLAIGTNAAEKESAPSVRR
jgi:hypothetical protein